MIKARPYQTVVTGMLHKTRVIYRFFASQRSYGYVLSQENQYLTPSFAPQIQRGQYD